MNLPKILILAFAALAIGGVYVYKMRKAPTAVEKVQVGDVLPVISIRILPAGDFEFIQKDGHRIHGKLRGDISPEGREEVIRLLNTSTQSKIVIVPGQVDVCVVDVLLTVKDGGKWAKELNLWDWLVQRKLAYQQPQTSPKRK